MFKEPFEKSLSDLPTGGITTKRIKNKKTGEVYEYKVYQWREDGKQKSRYLKDEEVEELSGLIEQRKKLEEEIAQNEIKKNEYEDSVVRTRCMAKRLNTGRNKYAVKERNERNYINFDENAYELFEVRENNTTYFQNVLYPTKPVYSYIQKGDELKKFTESVKDFKKREIITPLEKYVFGNEYNRVFILYGLRRTGKTTIIKQVIAEMTEEQLEKTAFIQVNSSMDLGKLNRELSTLKNEGYKYIFIDEVTLMNDFIEGASLFSDIYAASGIKIILSGTDSLGFWISKSNELYDRCYTLHTTFIHYREFENVLGIKGIEQYIQYGGTMSISGIHYNNYESNIFKDKITTDEYIDSAIANNIQHSLKNYKDEGHFRHLYSLYEAGELTSAINRVIEDINHRFTIKVFTEIPTREFKSGDLSLSARNLRKENNVLDLIDRDAVTKRLKEMLEIKNKDEQSVAIDKVHEKEIKEYLSALDLIEDIKIADIDNYGQYETRTAFTQAGLRYSQVKSLVDSLMRDNIFSNISFDDRKYVTERILNEVKGRMTEDIILLETAMAKKQYDVFKLQFADGEYDMVIFDSQNGGCEIFEIKYNTTINENQYRHLIDKEKTKKTEFIFGTIKGRYVLYRGESKMHENIQYINIEEYLSSLKNL